jgi:hypothetical protein
MADVTVDNDISSQLLIHNMSDSTDFTCDNCVKIKTQLLNVCLGLTSAKLIIKLLQEELKRPKFWDK